MVDVVEVRTVRNVGEIRSSLDAFVAGASGHADLARSILQSPKQQFWVFSAETGAFGPSKFVGLAEMTFPLYERCRSLQRRKEKPPAFDGARTRAAIKAACRADFLPSPELSDKLRAWADGVFGSDVLGARGGDQWAFVTLPPKGARPGTANASGDRGTRVTMDGLIPGDTYDRHELAALWGYQDWHAIGKGVVTPAGDNKIILFITREKQTSLRQYQDHFVGDDLYMEGEDDHRADSRILASATSGDEVYLFFRDRHHSDFTYLDRVVLKRAEPHTKTPSLFVFATQRAAILAASAVRTDQELAGETERLPRGEDSEDSLHVDAPFVPDAEGGRRIARHVVYERSRRNRQRAIELHGVTCIACGFNFNKFYGPDLARDYIQVHHVESITRAQGRQVDPATDLTPLCANCHSMVHRNSRKGPMNIPDLVRAIQRQRRGEDGRGS